jgi:hypothetical protein
MVNQKETFLHSGICHRAFHPQRVRRVVCRPSYGVALFFVLLQQIKGWIAEITTAVQ